MNSVRELASAPADLDPALNTTARMLHARRVAAPDHVAFRVVKPAAADGDASLVEITTEAFASQVEAAAALLVNWGIERGDRVVIAGRTSYAWAVAEFALWYAGAVVVPLYPGTPSQRLRQVVEASRAPLVLVDAGQDITAAALPGGVRVAALETLTRAAPASEADVAMLRATWEAVDTLDPATVVLTSGTTAEPRPAVITHANLTAVAQGIRQEYRRFLHEDASTVIMLPLSHILARGLQLVCVHAGMAITHLDDPSKVLPVLRLVRPTFLVVVPRVLEKVREKMHALAGTYGLGALMRRCESLAIRRAEGEQQGHPNDGSAPLRRGRGLPTALADLTVFALMRRLFGGRLELLLSGAATLPRELGLFMQGAGLPVIQGYGLTETTAPATGQRWGSLRAGTVGTPVPGTRVRLSEDDEILVRGPGVFAGYGFDPTTCTPALDAEGFFPTGDLGRIEDGQLVVIGRKKDLITTAYGKSISPAAWEEALERLPEVQHAMVVGEGRPFLLGVVLIGAGNGTANGTGDGTTSARPLEPVGAVPAEVLRRSDRAAAAVNRSEAVRAVLAVHGGIDDDPDLVTPTGKLRKKAVYARLAPLIDAEYARLSRA